MRPFKPRLRMSTDSWYVGVDGKLFKLDQAKQSAHARFHELMHHGVAEGMATMRQAVDAYWNWMTKRRTESTRGRFWFPMPFLSRADGAIRCSHPFHSRDS